MNATAAYCSACRAHVYVAADGTCEFGHPRSHLRGIYSAEIDRRTARPLPPGFDQHASLSRPLAPVAPVALPSLDEQADPDSYDTSGISLNAPFAPVISAMGAGALPRALVVTGADSGLRHVLGLRIGGSVVRSANAGGLVSTPLIVALAFVSVLAIGVSVVL